MQEHPRAGSVAAPSPLPFPKKYKTHQGNYKGRKPIPHHGNTIPGGRRSLLRLLLHSVRLRLLRSILPCFPWIPLRSLTVQFSSAGGAVLPTWMLRKPKTARLHLSSASRQPTRHFCFPLRLLLDPCPHRGLVVFPLVAVLEEVVSRLVSTIIVFRVAPPAVVARFVPRPLQITRPDLSW